MLHGTSDLRIFVIPALSWNLYHSRFLPSYLPAGRRRNDTGSELDHRVATIEIILLNSFGLTLAPPTNAPSIPWYSKNSLIFLLFTEPP